MRILAIRGANLASLADRFEVDFTAEPLASAGLFAISGPTGAGKSTLLDALCLALYDHTPRLAKAQAKGIGLPDVADETIAPGDSRTLLRRGAAAGHAEVDFRGNDGIAYRSRWSVRRAHNRPRGRLQAAEMSLLRIADAQPVTGRLKTEVLQAIVGLIGLSFEQFTRAVLLAQNEFFAFLKAPDDDRAALLQTLTGTERFSRLSVMAFERARDEQQALRALDDRLSGQAPLSDEARATCEAEEERLRATLAGLAAHAKALSDATTWREQRDAARRGVASAQLACDQAAARHRDASARRAHLARVDAVQLAAPLRSECTRTQEDVRKAQRELERCVQWRSASASALADAAALAVDADRARVAARERQRELQPLLAEARRLDATYAARSPDAQRQQRRAQELRERAERAVRQLAVRENDLAKARAALLTIEAEAAALTPAQALANDWRHYDALFEQANRALETLSRAKEADALAARNLGSAINQDIERQRLAEQAVRIETAASNDWHAAQAAVQACDGAALDAARQTRDESEAAWRTAHDTWQALTRSRAAEIQSSAQRHATEQQYGSAHDALAGAEAARPASVEKEAQADRCLQIATLACGDARVMRDRLLPDVPCPVCGSTAHPYVAHGDEAVDTPSQAALHALREEFDRQRAALKDLDDTIAVARADMQRLAQERVTLDATLRTAQRETTQALRNWQALPHAVLAQICRVAVRTFDAIDGEADIAAIAAALDIGRHRLDDATLDLQRRHAALAKAELERDAARDRTLAARDASRETARQRDNAVAALEAARVGVDNAATRAHEAQRALDDLLDSLDGAGLLGLLDLPALATLISGDQADRKVAGWRTRWLAAPTAFHDACRALAEHCRTITEHDVRLRAEIAALIPETEALRDAVRNSRRDADDATREAADRTAEIDTLREQRIAVFGAGPYAQASSAEIERDLDARLTAATGAHQATVREQTARDGDHRAALERQSSAATTLDAAQQAAAEAEHRLDEWIDDFNRLATAQAVAAAMHGHREAVDHAIAATATAAPVDEAAVAAAVPVEPISRTSLDALLAHDAAWRTDERRVLDVLDRALAEARVVLNERRDTCRAFDETPATIANALLQAARAVALGVGPGVDGDVRGDRVADAANTETSVSSLPDSQAGPGHDSPDQALPAGPEGHAAPSDARATLPARFVTTLDEQALLLLRQRVDSRQAAMHEAWSDAVVALRTDDKRRGETAALLQTIAERRLAAQPWQMLGEVIGSADGRRFRNLAQQTTLDVLLGYANAQLRLLTQRYRLQRIPDSLALLVIDQYMADEMRSVHSLSGGESFLVSLALALGLASLSSHRVRVESLFIDEGFGTLDADTLAVAMDALDSLQAQGRKVGVISHVAEMTERIGTRVEVTRTDGGRSRVRVAA